MVVMKGVAMMPGRRQLLGGQRQHTAHQLCEDDAEEQRHADDHCVADDIVILAGVEVGVHQ